MIESRTEDVGGGIQGTDERIRHGFRGTFLLGKNGRRKGESSLMGMQGQRQEPGSFPPSALTLS